MVAPRLPSGCTGHPNLSLPLHWGWQGLGPEVWVLILWLPQRLLGLLLGGCGGGGLGGVVALEAQGGWCAHGGHAVPLDAACAIEAAAVDAEAVTHGAAAAAWDACHAVELC